jgi:hypothetical protein
MDIYTISFILSTLWVGPFWFAMLINPEKDKTKKIAQWSTIFFRPHSDLDACHGNEPPGLN